jgi:hypothetical protein
MDEVLLLDGAKEERCLRLGAEEPLCNGGHRVHRVRRPIADGKWGGTASNFTIGCFGR